MSSSCVRNWCEQHVYAPMPRLQVALPVPAKLCTHLVIRLLPPMWTYQVLECSLLAALHCSSLVGAHHSFEPLLSTCHSRAQLERLKSNSNSVSLCLVTYTDNQFACLKSASHVIRARPCGVTVLDDHAGVRVHPRRLSMVSLGDVPHMTTKSDRT
jgi:hypothetical protein